MVAGDMLHWMVFAGWYLLDGIRWMAFAEWCPVWNPDSGAAFAWLAANGIGIQM